MNEELPKLFCGIIVSQNGGSPKYYDPYDGDSPPTLGQVPPKFGRKAPHCSSSGLDDMPVRVCMLEGKLTGT